MRTSRLGACAAGLLATGLLSPGVAAATPKAPPPVITVVDLLGPNGEPLTYATEVNLRGQVAGGQGQVGVVWEDGEATAVVPGTFGSSLIDISESGQVVGGYQAGLFELPKPLAWEDGRLTRLPPTDPPFDSGYAVSVNEVGTVLGLQFDPTPTSLQYRVVAWEDGAVTGIFGPPAAFGIHDALGEINNRDQALVVIPGVNPTAAVWKVGGGVTSLGTLGGAGSSAGAINEVGVVAGVSDTATGEQHAFVWRDGRMRDLGTLGGASSYLGVDGGNFGWIDRHALNEWGHVVGTSATADGRQHAFVWRNGRMTDLGTLGGATSHAAAVNNWGQVVGWSETASGEEHGFLWENGRMTDLGSLAGPGSSRATDINDRGQITGAVFDGGTTRAVLWTAPPGRREG